MTSTSFHKKILSAAAVGLAVFALVAGMHRTRWFEVVELKALDHLVRRYADPAKADSNLLLLAIDESSLEAFGRWPPLTPERTGWGAGTRAFPDRPNALRVVLGEVSRTERTTDLFVLEANVDDMTGELAGHVIGLLLEAGALDAWAVPATMKKGRPGLLLSALTRAAFADSLAALVLRETTSIGVRRLQAERLERPRTVVEVETRFGLIPVKVSEGPYGPPQAKPEFDACARAATAAGVPVREVIAEALSVWSRARS